MTEDDTPKVQLEKMDIGLHDPFMLEKTNAKLKDTDEYADVDMVGKVVTMVESLKVGFLHGYHPDGDRTTDMLSFTVMVNGFTALIEQGDTFAINEENRVEHFLAFTPGEVSDLIASMVLIFFTPDQMEELFQLIRKKGAEKVHKTALDSMFQGLENELRKEGNDD